MSASVPKMFATMTSPILIGGLIFTSERNFIHSFNILLGIGLFVLTGKSGRELPSVVTVVVRMRTGDLNSIVAYSLPRSHSFPETFRTSPVLLTSNSI